MSKLLRRTWLLGASSWLAGCKLYDSERHKPIQVTPELSDEDKALKYKFRGIFGGELRVDAMIRMPPVALHTPDGRLFNIGHGSFGPGGATISGYGGSAEGDRLPMPKYLRMMRFAPGAKFIDYLEKLPVYEGPVLLDINVPIATRIPDEVLDRVRQYKGSLSLKLRLTMDTILVGWHVNQGKTYSSWKTDQWGSSYAPDEDEMPGGDFREARIYNGQVVRKGWYIHPKTGQKVETDF